MARVGCIVMYSKSVDKNQTIPCGTVFYEDGTEEEVSLKQAAEMALTMSLENGYANAIENERYFNTTYKSFINEKEKYKELAQNIKNKDQSKPIVTKIDIDYRKKLPEGIREVEPPKVIKGEPKKEEKNEEQIIDDIIKEHLDEIEPEEEVDIDFDEIEKKINEVMEKELKERDNQKNSNQNDLDNMINEQNKRVEEENINKR